MLSSISVALLAAVTVASETEGFGAVPGLGHHGDNYLGGYDGYVPHYDTRGVYDDHYVEPKAEVKSGLLERGSLKQKRRRDPPKVSTFVEPQPVVKDTRKTGKYYDWRDYEPNKYEGKDPYAHCVYPEDQTHLDTAEYQALSAVCKEELIWKQVLRDERRERFYKGFEFESLFDQDMNLTYDSVTDTMPVNRLKKTHPVGLTAKIELIPHPDQPYTGCFKGVEHGIMRISDTTATTPEVPKTAPGFGLKFLRDGMYSANILAMFAFDGQKSFNFFKNRWVTILREFNNSCARETIGKHLAGVTDHLGATSVMDVADFDQYGNKEEEPHWPFQLEFEPYDVFGWEDEYQNDFQDQIEPIPINTVMFKVFGFDEPPELGGEERLIGWIVSRSDQLSSFWGDTQLFFQHRRLDDDIKRRPHYFDMLQFWPNGLFHETPLQNPAPMQKCPFFFLFEKAGLV